MNPKNFLNNQCFVIMPFGPKKLEDGSEYDFDKLYKNVFKEAIKKVKLPEGGNLQAKRADDTNISGIITEEMFRDILYSRIVLADITTMNPNVFYELGVRHSLRPTSTIMVKDKKYSQKIPFDIKDNRVFEYDVSGFELNNAIASISEKLRATLEKPAYDSPVYTTLRDDLIWPNYEAEILNNVFESYHQAQIRREIVQQYMNEVKRASQNRNLYAAIAACKGARELEPHSLKINMKLGLLLKDTGNIEEASEVFERIARTHPSYAGAWREWGVTLNKLKKPSDAIQKLRKAVELNAFDPDAWGALGGTYKTINQFGESLHAYEKGLKNSPRDTYNLLNYILMFAIENKTFPKTDELENALTNALTHCQTQIDSQENLPWCYFDLANILFLTGKPFEKTLRDAVAQATADWQIKTASKTYELLIETNTMKNEAELALTVINGNKGSK